MRRQLSQQATEILGKSALVIITERVDDVALLIGQMVKMGWPEVLDRPSPRHWKQRGRSWGWTAVMGLASILPEGDHRKVSVAADITGMNHTLSPLSGQGIAPLDGRDDRRAPLLKHVSTPRYGHGIEGDVPARSMAVYAWPQEVIRWDATTVSGDHEVTEGGLWQVGPRKDDPTRPHITGMMGSLDPVGLPLATEGWSGERADEGLSMPLIDRIQAGLSHSGVLCVGDGTRSALATRAPLVGHQHVSVSPLPCTGATAEAMAAWMAEGGATDEAGELERMFRTHARGHAVRAAEGSECARTCGAQEGEEAWTERV